jgi:hypothetical protein
VAVLKNVRPFGADGQGFAGVDFALTGLMLALGILNAVDVGFYIYQRMEVEYAAEVGAQAAWKTCNNLNGKPLLPATQNCTVANDATVSLTSAIATAIQSTSLNNNNKSVSLASGYPTEGYYCTNASNVLQSYRGLRGGKPPLCGGGSGALLFGQFHPVRHCHGDSELRPNPLSGPEQSGIFGIKTFMRPSSQRNAQLCTQRRGGAMDNTVVRNRLLSLSVFGSVAVIL